jgi:hypothetical protein
MRKLAGAALIGMVVMAALFLLTAVSAAGAQRRLEQLKADAAAMDAIAKLNQEALQPDIRRCLEQELTPVYAVNPEQIIVPSARLTAEAFKIIVCVEAK